MMNYLRNHKQNLIFYSISFVLPAFIMFTVLFSKNIYWGSDTTLLASDGFHQYVIFDTLIRNILHGTDSLFYSFKGGLGFNVFALMSYYLGSFLTPFTYFFDVRNMADAFYLFTLIKFGLIGLSAFYSLDQLYPKLKKHLTLLLSASYALMSFTTSQLELNNWLDIFILLPLILLGLNHLISKKGTSLYFLTLSCLFIQNYFFGFMTAIFLLLWFFVQASWDFKERLKRFADFALVSILSAAASAFMLLPTLLDLSSHGEKTAEHFNLLSSDIGYFDLFAKTIIGSYDTTKYGSIPTFYIGLFPLILALTFFFVKTIKGQVKLAYLFLIVLVIASFIFQPLDLFWQGMHSPNMFLHRYSWILSTIILIMAAETLSGIEYLSVKSFLPAFALLGIGFTGVFFFRESYDFLTPTHFILTGLFLVGYGVILFSYFNKGAFQKLMIAFTLIFTILELSFNSFFQIEGIENDWNFPSRNVYEDNGKEVDSYVKLANQETPDFFRLEKLIHQTLNDGMKFNYNSISQFSSVKNTLSAQLLNALGYYSQGNHAFISYHNNTILMDSLFSVAYNISTQDPHKFGFYLRKSGSHFNLYKNSYHLPLALMSKGIYNDVNLNSDPLTNQEKIVKELTGVKDSFFTEVPIISAKNSQVLNGRAAVTDLKGSQAKVYYSVKAPANSQLYINLPNISFSNEEEKSILLTVKNRKTQQIADNSYDLFNLGHYQKEQLLSFKFNFPDNKTVSYDLPHVYALNLTAYQKAMDQLKSSAIKVSTQKNRIFTSYTAKKKSSLIYTLPYDKGWSAVQDGEKVDIKKAQGGFMKINVKKGRGKITMTFIPQGLHQGILISSFGIFLFILYRLYYQKSIRKDNKSSTKTN
ncbi:YfhO family protein [Streptococcus devriesei]|uniref:YfhO family protein n=1 Tax=Streptococcus devriesei TaxID=231233 RepID=UPI00041FDDAC|nr:YfhO family protein [Streptococcus devriesei]